MKISAKLKFIVVRVCLGLAGLLIVVALIWHRQINSRIEYIRAAKEYSAYHYTATDELLKSAIADDPGWADPYFYRGTIYLYRHNYAAAEKDYSEALRLGYDKWWSYVELAGCLHMQGKVQAALDNYRLALAANSKGLSVRSNMADIYYRLGNIDEAKRLCDEELGLDPHSCVALINRAQCYMVMHQPGQTITDTTQALDSPELKSQMLQRDVRREALRLRALAYNATGQTANAERDLATIRGMFLIKHNREGEAVAMESDFAQKISAKRFILCTDLTPEAAKRMADFCDRFLNYVDRNVYRLDPGFYVHVFVYKDSADFEKMKLKLRAKGATYGVYDEHMNAMFVRDESLGTLAHELIHKALENASFRDPWAQEGLASLYERDYGYKLGDEYQLTIGLPSPWRWHDIFKFEQMNLLEMIADQDINHEEGKRQLLALFVYHSGKLQKYLEVSRSGDFGRYETALEASFGKSAIELEPSWKRFWQNVRANHEELAGVPRSTVFDTKEEFEQFCQKTDLDHMVSVVHKGCTLKD